MPGQARAPPGNARAPQGALLVVICVARLLRCPAQARGRWSNTEQEVVDRVVRDKLRREHGLSLESAGFRKFLVSIGETKKNAKKRRLAAALMRAIRIADRGTRALAVSNRFYTVKSPRGAHAWLLETVS